MQNVHHKAVILHSEMALTHTVLSCWFLFKSGSLDKVDEAKKGALRTKETRASVPFLTVCLNRLPADPLSLWASLFLLHHPHLASSSRWYQPRVVITFYKLGNIARSWITNISSLNSGRYGSHLILFQSVAGPFEEEEAGAGELLLACKHLQPQHGWLFYQSWTINPCWKRSNNNQKKEQK